MSYSADPWKYNSLWDRKEIRSVLEGLPPTAKIYVSVDYSGSSKMSIPDPQIDRAFAGALVSADNEYLSSTKALRILDELEALENNTAIPEKPKSIPWWYLTVPTSRKQTAETIFWSVLLTMLFTLLLSHQIQLLAQR